MKKTTLGSMMAAASLFAVTACGSILAPPTGTPDDAGTGSNVVTPCETASDCSDGTACDLEAKECVADALTIDNTDLVSDGLRYWTATSGPKLVGAYQGSADAVVQVKVGAGAPIAATTNGSVWSAQLAPGTILETDTLVKVTLTDPGQGVVELEGVFAVDVAPPTIALGASKVRDERGDVITFDDQGPKHDHQGQEIDLGVGCPTVYKYSYLMDAAAPVYGSESAPNPLAWAMSVQDTKVASVEYRVVDAAQSVVRDWTTIVGAGAAYPIVLNRDGATGIGAAATKAGTYTIEVRAKDWGERVAMSSYCINFVPLAAPLAFAQAATPTDANALSGWRLQTNSPISRVLNPGVGAAIAEQVITQYSSEPVAVSLGVPALGGTWRMQDASGWVPTSSTRTTISCANTNCDPGIVTSWSSFSGALTSYAKSAVLVDSNGSPVPASLGGYLIPGRAVGAPPATYRVRVNISNVSHFVIAGLSYAERVNESLNYTGTPETNSTSACGGRDVLGTSCGRWTNYKYLRAIKTIGLSVNAFTIPLTVAATQGGTFAAAPHTTSAMFVAPAVNWDGGSEDTLPNP